MGTFRWVPVLTVLVAALAMLGNDLVLARKAGGGGGGGMSRSGPAASGSVRTQRSAKPAKKPDTRREGKQDARDTRRDVKQDARDTRRDAKDDVRDTRRDVKQDNRTTRRVVGHEIREERREDHHEWHEDRWKRRAGAALTISAFRALTCTTSTIVVGSVTYYRCGGTWYQQAHQSGDVVYIVVTAPAGY
jgi:hypothetical protein